MDQPQLSIVAPLFNESETFPHLIERLNRLLDGLPWRVEVVLVDDGSRDRTPELMQALALSDPRYVGVFLSRNHGHQLALSAGLAAAQGTEAVMVIDGDLQDPPELLPQFYEKLQEGFDVVYAVRRKRKENWVKRSSYFLFYRLLKSISTIDIPLDSGDFAMMSRRVVDVLNQMPEESRYLRGMRAWVGFRQTGLEYERDERVAGASKYSFKQLFRLAYNGIFNFSEFPIKFLTRLGGGAIALALVYFFYNVVKRFVLGQAVPQGFTALLFTIIFFGGINLVGLGIIGEYVLRVFFQSKNRPLFIVKGRIRGGKWE